MYFVPITIEFLSLAMVAGILLGTPMLSRWMNRGFFSWRGLFIASNLQTIGIFLASLIVVFLPSDIDPLVLLFILFLVTSFIEFGMVKLFFQHDLPGNKGALAAVIVNVALYLLLFVLAAVNLYL